MKLFKKLLLARIKTFNVIIFSFLFGFALMSLAVLSMDGDKYVFYLSLWLGLVFFLAIPLFLAIFLLKTAIKTARKLSEPTIYDLIITILT